MKNRFRVRLTDLKVLGTEEIDLRSLIDETFDNTDRVMAIRHCMRGWRTLLAGDDGRCPDYFQGRIFKA